MIGEMSNLLIENEEKFEDADEERILLKCTHKIIFVELNFITYSNRV
jgi:hypothetical protein